MFVIVLPILLAAQPSVMGSNASGASPFETTNKESVETAATETKVCREFPPITGSRIRKKTRICHTAADWEIYDKNAKSVVREFQRGQTNPEMKQAGKGGG